MRTSKRLLALVSTVLMLATLFALPYGAAAEDATPTSDLGLVVGVVQEDAVTQTVNGGDFIGRQFNDLNPVIDLTKAAGNYAIVAEIKVHQDYGFTNADWMQAALGDGNTNIVPSEGSGFNPGHPITTWLPKTGRANDEWMKLAIPLSGYTGTDIKSVQFNIYNHPERYDSNLTSDDRLHGASISFRHVYVVDMSRNADGSIKEAAATFGSPYEEEVTYVNADGNHTVTCIPSTNIFYNGLTSGMAREDLNLQFDIMYTSDNADFASNKIVNGSIRLYDPNERNGGGSYLSGKISQKDTWYHINVPLTEFPSDMSVGAINRIFSFNYNDASVGGVQTNPGFTTHVKNIQLTHNGYSALKAAVDGGKNLVYDVDANATAYESALADARDVLYGSTSTYADLATALSNLNTAKAALTNMKDVTYEVLTFSQHAYKASTTWGNNSKKFIFDWRTGDGVTSTTGVDLTDDGSTIGANRYFALTVTLDKNNGYAGTVDTMDLLDTVNIRVRTNVGSEKRTNDYNAVVVSKEITETKSVYQLEAALNSDAQYQVEWNNVRDAIIYPNLKVGSGENDNIPPATMTLSDVKIINKTAEAVDVEIAEVAEGYIVPGKYTAASTAAYLALQSQAQALVANPDATLQQKTQLLAQVDAAKAQFVPVVTEYVQFGAPDTLVANFWNSGINGQHGLGTRNYPVTANTITGSEDFSKLQLRMEVRVTRDDGVGDLSKSIVNGNIKLLGSTINGQKNFGGFMPGTALSGEWATLYFPLSDFGFTAESDLSDLNNFQMFGYNDLRNVSDNPGELIEMRNIAIIDGTNISAVEALAAAFADVTDGGRNEFTKESLAAYQAIYDQWYPVYETVDLSRAEEAIAAMAAARANLIQVEEDVMTFSAFNKTYNHNNNQNMFYADWTTSDQGLVDISNHNLDKLYLRFDITFNAKDGLADPLTELSIGGRRVALRHNVTGEPGFNHQGYALLPENPYVIGETYSANIKLTDTNMQDKRDGDNILQQIIFWCYVDQSVSETAQDDYTMTISNARIVDVTKEALREELEAAALTAEELSAATGITYTNTADYDAAVAAAKAVLAQENATYTEMIEALDAINAAKAQMGQIAHILKVFTGLNASSNYGTNYLQVGWSNDEISDLSGFDRDNLVLRFNVNLHGENGSTEIPAGVTAVETRSSYLEVRNGADEAIRLLMERTWKIGDNAEEVDLSGQAALLANLKDARVFGYAKEDGTGATNSYQLTVSNARIVDTSVEKAFGKLSVVGNGYIELTGGLLSGTQDTLVAHPADGYVLAGWVINGEWTDEENPTAIADGQQNATAYFVKEDEAVVFFYGKSNQFFDMQVVKATDAAAALSATAAPAIYGYTFESWDQSAEDLAIAISAGTTVSVNANYVQDAASTAYTVTTVGDMTVKHSGALVSNTTFNAQFDDRITVTATGEGFSYWKLDGMVVSFSTSYIFYVSGDNEIEAVYNDDSVSSDVVRMEIKKNYIDDNASGKKDWTIVAQNYVPEGTTIVEYGVIFAPAATDLSAGIDTLTAGKDYVAVAASSVTPNRQYMITLRSVKPGAARQAVAYLIDGEGNTYYSAVLSQVIN